MDKYLKEDSSYKRLYNEYKKYGNLIVAVDFDDTLYDFHGKGYNYKMVSQLIRELYKINCWIIIWTGNQDSSFVKNYLEENDIPYNSINEEADVSKKLLKGKFPRKVYANVYLDDRAGLKQVYNELKKLVNELQSK